MSSSRIALTFVFTLLPLLALTAPLPAAVEVTFDDRVLYLNGYLDGVLGFEEYFGDAFASETGEFMSPGFNRSIGDSRGLDISFVSSGASITSNIDFGADHVVTFTGVGQSSGDLLVDDTDASAGTAFGSSEFDVDLTLSDVPYRFDFGSMINASGDGRTSASFYAGPSLSDRQLFRYTTDTQGNGVYHASGVVPPGDYRLDVFATSYININTAPGEGMAAALFEFSLGLTPVAFGDFDGDGDFTCVDVDALVAEIAGGGNDSLFDLDGNAAVDTVDLQAWLAIAGAAQLASGNPYLPGDANLDGAVDVLDFDRWNSNKFTYTAAWCAGDFTADGLVDASDFNRWNLNKFTTADDAPWQVPEPTGITILLLALVSWRRWSLPV